MDVDNSFQTYASKKIDSKNTHGTGCSLSSAIASYLALGYDYKTSIGLAKEYVYSAIEESKDIFSGKGNGSLNHFFNPSKTKNFMKVIVNKKQIEDRNANKYLSTIRIIASRGIFLCSCNW